MILEKESTKETDEFYYYIGYESGIYGLPKAVKNEIPLAHKIKINITFINGKFSHCSFPFENSYNRNQWKVLGAINDEIAKLEELYKKEEE